MITFKDVTIEGQATKALSLKLLAVDSAVFNHSHNTPGYRQQLWGIVHRNVSVASDFRQMGFSCFVWINDLTGKLSVNNRRVTFIDMKNGHATLGGALRRSLTVIMAKFQSHHPAASARCTLSRLLSFDFPAVFAYFIVANNSVYTVQSCRHTLNFQLQFKCMATANKTQ